MTCNHYVKDKGSKASGVLACHLCGAEWRLDMFGVSWVAPQPKPEARTKP